MRLAQAAVLLLACLAATAFAKAPDCPRCFAMDVTYEAHKRFLDSIDKGLEDRSRRVKELTNKVIGGQALDAAEKAELRTKTDEMKELDKAKSAWQPIVDQMKRDRDGCVQACPIDRPPPGTGVLPGTTPAPKPGGPPPGGSSMSPLERLPRVPAAVCDSCKGAHADAVALSMDAEEAASEAADAETSLRAMAAIDAGQEFRGVFREMTQYREPRLREELRESAKRRQEETLGKFLGVLERLEAAIAKVRACNQRCAQGADKPGRGNTLPGSPPTTAPLPPERPMKPLGAPGAPLPPTGAPLAPSVGPARGLPPLPEIPPPACRECAELAGYALELRDEVEYLGELAAEAKAMLENIDAASRGNTANPAARAFAEMDASRRAQLREQWRQSVIGREDELNDALRELDDVLDDLHECNAICRQRGAPPYTGPIGVIGDRSPRAIFPGPDFTVPEVPPAACPQCNAAVQHALQLRQRVQAIALVLMVTRPPVSWPYEQLGRAMRALEEAIDRIYACNRLCLLVLTNPTIITVINITGVNPFDPFNPIGPTTPQQPPSSGPGTVQFSSASYGGTEGTTVVVTVVRVGSAAGAASVGYVASDRTATAGADFVAAQGTLQWADGDASPRTFNVQLVDDSLLENTELVELTLLNPVGVRFSEPSRATISIADNDAPVPSGTVQFSSSSYSTAEGQGAVTITVTRTGGSGGAAAVSYATQPGSASSADFGGASSTLTWPAGDASPRSFTVAIVDDSQVESTETFNVTLSNASGAALGAPAQATIAIADNDVASGPCGTQGHAWQQNTGNYNCSGSCNPTPSSAGLAINGTRVSIGNFHAGGVATFTGCTNSLNSDRNDLTYFGQSNHRATITRSSNNAFNANITSSGGGTCSFSCTRTGP